MGSKQYFNVLLTKFLFFAPMMGIIVPLSSEVSVTGAIFIALVATIAAFFTADLVVLPRFGNGPALLVDIIISLAVVWMYAWFLYKTHPTILGFVILAVVLAFGEWYYHQYIKRELFGRGKRNPR